MSDCDRCGKKIRYGTLCDYCKGHCEGYSLGKSHGIKQGKADAIDELKEKYLDADAYNEGVADGWESAIDEFADVLCKLNWKDIIEFVDVPSFLRSVSEQLKGQK